MGIGHGDGDAQAAFLTEKIASLRIFEDAEEKMNLSLRDTGYGAMVISQFTLYADTRKGRRPSFIDAGAPEEAKVLYAKFCARARELGLTVAEGIFAADMKVALVNDGPVTICLDSRAGPLVA